MSTWSTPKTDWATDDAVGTADLNRIEGNIEALLLGHGVAPISIASATSLAITTAGDIFTVSGAVTIDYIKTTGRLAGAKIYMIFDEAIGPTIRHNQGSAGAEYAKILMADTIYGTEQYEMLCFIFDGTVWRWLTTT